MSKRMAIMLRGERWYLSRRPLPYSWGECDRDAREIVLDARIEGELLLDALIHECLHALQPDLVEEAVNLMARDVAHAAARLGLVERDP